MPPKLLLRSALLLAMVAPHLCVASLPSEDKQLQSQRRDFLAARQAVRDGKITQFRRLSGGLADYPLYPYLRYEELRRGLARADASAVRQFLTEHGETPLAQMLRRAWLEQLAARQRWQTFLEDYQEDTGSVDLRCYAARARLKSGSDESVWDEVERLWLVGVSQPAACDPVFEAWRREGRMGRQQVIERIGLAMERGQLALVSYLMRFLPEADELWVKRWQRVHRRPEAELPRLPQNIDPFWSPRLFAHGVRRLARTDPEKADALWQERPVGFTLPEDKESQTERDIALRLAYQRHRLAIRRLAAAADRGDDPEVRHWRVRAALWHRDWNEVLTALDGLTVEEQAEPDWQYWRGRALQALGRTGEATDSYRAAAACRCYYGFLAADRIGVPPAIDSVPLDIGEQQLMQMASEPPAVRAKELHALGLITEARREWRDFTAPMDSERLRTAAKLADAWGWHDQAILTLGRTDSLSDLELRFPTPFQEQVTAASERRELDIAFVYAVMRQESAFNENARSPVGALGLMQLMPSTARLTARRFKYPIPKTYDLLSAGHNIHLGTAHLRHLLNRYEGNRLYTMAAYNAGPHRLTRWLPKEESLPADIWIASMPFEETREYVKRILAYTLIYEWRLGREPTPMSAFLHAIEPYPTLAEKISLNQRTQ